MDKVSAVLITRDKEIHPALKESLKDFDEVLVKTESPSVYERYLLAEKAKNEIIYVQDDDALIDHEEIWKAYKGQLTAGITLPHWYGYKDSGITLVGWGCFFPKYMLKSFQPYIDKYGVDAHLLREADRIFTYLNRPHTIVIQDHFDFIPQVERMWQEPEHWRSMRAAIEKVKTL